jgi:MFS family permease
VLLLLHSGLLQVLIFVLRPTTSYRALELGVPSGWLGLISASFLVAPLLFAVPAGRVSDRYGERRVLVLGGLLVLVSALLFVAVGTSVAGMVASNAVLGAGQVLSVVSEQAVLASLVEDGRHDASFGHYTFAASLGQAVGPALIAVLGGSAALPDAGRIFLGALVVALAYLVVTLLLARTVRGWITRARVTAPVRDVLVLPGLMRALYASCVVVSAVDVTLIYLPALGHQRGFSSVAVSSLLIVRAAFSMISRLGLGRLSLLLGRRTVMLGSTGLAAVSVAVAAVPMPVGPLLLVMAVAGSGLGIGQPLTMSWLAEATPDGLLGTAMSLRLAGNCLGQLLVPSLVGLVTVGAGVGGAFVITAGALASATTVARRFGTPAPGAVSQG